MRFTIRDLMWLMVVVAMGAGWWADKSRTVKARDAAIRDTRYALSFLLDPFAAPLPQKDRERLESMYFPSPLEH